ncbi:alpha/beta hydrolase [Arsukibacterium perlucidum]|uniref:alpha/beta hydrolase n=1 Tax=Arsukibacterium perlucidum TaxID=368811 RepID=UPI0003766DDE|nr:alpha/beta hydrolase-fold protein [Arsukibacterium perlucidum]
MRLWQFWLLAGLAALNLSASASAVANTQTNTEKSSPPALPQVNYGSLVRLPALLSAYVPERPIDVWLPEGYNSQQRYAVLYMHDGQMLFDASQTWNGQSWQLAETAQRLQQQALVRPFIVVAVHNAGAARHSEYFPQQPFLSLPAATRQQLYQLERSPGVKLFAGRVYSDNYLKFLVTELKPYIDQHFATDSSQPATFIMGSSMGGLISWYAQTVYPQVFGGAAALSTHWPGIFSVEDNPVPQAFLTYLAGHLPAPGQHKWYFDYGDQSLDALYPPLQQQVDQLFRRKQFSAPLWRSELFAGADHSENSWAARLAEPLTFLLAAPVQQVTK